MKRLLCISVLLLAGLVLLHNPHDVNWDGRVNVLDVQLVINDILNAPTTTQ